MKKKLIIVAHDYGLCGSVNKGTEYVLEHKNNVVTEVSLLPNAPSSQKAAEYIKKRNVSASLCLNLTTFKPLSKNVPSLVDSRGNFLRVDITTWDFSVIEKHKEKDVEKEIKAQYNWFLENVGRKPNAILSRKNETGDPKILMPTVELAKSEGVALRSPVWKWKANYGAQSYVEQSGVKSTKNVFLGLLDWMGRFGYDTARDWDKLCEDIKEFEGISELLVFIGFVDEELMRISELNWQRGQFVYLVEQGIITGKIRENFNLIDYRML